MDVFRLYMVFFLQCNAREIIIKMSPYSAENLHNIMEEDI